MSLRLEILERGHATPKRTLIRVVERVGRVRMDDVVRVSLYRPRFFGRAWLRFVRSVMRGPSRWTPGERELLAAFTAALAPKLARPSDVIAIAMMRRFMDRCSSL